MATTTISLHRSTVATKAIMGVTGFILFGFLVGHMIGNLQVLPVMGGAEKYNKYAHFLQSLGGALWVIRLALLTALGLHIWSAWRLTQLNTAARPVAYAAPLKAKGSSFASRTMKWSGPIVGLYILYHLLHFTVAPDAMVPGFAHGDVYRAVVKSFSNPLVSLVYITANVLIGIHLWHGLWSLFQSLGLNHPKYNAHRRHFATAFSVIITAGFLSVPLGVMFGIVK